MAWNLRFWKALTDESGPETKWNHDVHPAPLDVPLAQQGQIASYISSIASISSVASARLNSFGQDIRIGFQSGDPGSAFAGPFDDYILIDINASKKIYFFNTFGELVQGDVRLTIMHELAHIYLRKRDPEEATEAEMNAADFDFRGPVVKEQNDIAQSAGLVRQIQTSYFSAFSSDDSVFKYFSAGFSYSGSRAVDTVRIGDPGANDIDHSENTKLLTDVLFGLGGNDTLNGGKGSDYLYGGGDDDTFIGSDGDDLFHGGGTRSSAGAALSIEDDGIDTADYSAAAATEFIKITTDVTKNSFHAGALNAANRLLIQQSGTGKGTATIISIEKVKGTAGVDTFEVTQMVSAQLAGRDGKGGLAEVDLAGQDKPDVEGDLIDATKMQEKLVIDLHSTSGFIQVKDDADKKVKVLNAERAWGGEKDDQIKGNDKANELKGGKGDDEINGEGGDDQIEGGEGKDKLKGGAGEDKIDGGAGDDTIDGGEGKDKLEGGEGNDTLKGGAGQDELRGGAGNDVIDGASDGDVVIDGASDGGFSIGAVSGGSGGDLLYGGGGADTFKTNNGDVIFDPDRSDSVLLGSLMLRGGEREKPPEDPCAAPEPREDENNVKSGTYKGRNGDNYQYSKENSTLTVTGSEGTVVLQNWSNGGGGIKLKNTRPPVQQAECNRDPLILDLNNDRNVVAELYDVSVYFDIDNDGIMERVAWALPQDGLLALDRNGDGMITSGSELFGTGTVVARANGTITLGTSGFSDLALLDTNQDLQVDANDASFAMLRVWQDANSNGVSDAGELKSLSELGIVSISLRTRTSDDLDCGCDGTRVVSMSDATMADGTRIGVYDAFLAVDNYDTIHTNLPEIPADVALLPFLIGSGKVADLDVAMVRDPLLREMVEALAALNISDAAELPGLVERILLRWTGADQVAADARGPWMNGQWLAAIEAFNGSDFRQNGTISDPRPDAASAIVSAWQEILDLATAQLLGQIPLGQTMLPGITFEAGAFFVVADGTQLANVFQTLASNAPAGMVDRLVYWHIGLSAIAAAAGEFGLSVAQIDTAASSWLQAGGISMTAAAVRRMILGGDSGHVSGTSTFVAWEGYDWLHSTADAAVLNGNSGDDHYIVRNGQAVVIKDAAGFDELWFPDLARADANITFLALDGRYELTVRSLDGLTSVTTAGVYAAGGVSLSIDRIRFADGIVVEVGDTMAQNSVATDGPDVISADPQLGSRLDGGAGSDILLGYAGDDEFVVGPGQGSDLIIERGGSAGDVLLIGATRSQTIFEVSADTAGRDLVIRFVGSSDIITIRGQRLAEVFAIETFRFSDGGSITAAAVEALLLSGSPGDDTLIGGYRDDRLDGGPGNDLLIGGGGTDTYVFGPDSGHDIVRDNGLSIIEFAAGITVQDLVLRRGGDHFADLVIEFGSGASLLIENQMLANRIVEFRFVGSNPLTWAELRPFVDQSGGAEIRGTSRGDDLEGTAGHDIYLPGKGNDVIRDPGGNDVYQFRRGDGSDTIYDWAGEDVLQFGEGIALQDLRWARDENSLSIFIGSDRIIIPSFFTLGGNSIESLRFHDGSLLDLTTMVGVTVGTAGNDQLFDLSSKASSPRPDTLFFPGAGDDVITGSTAHDVIHLESGFGRDTFIDTRSYPFHYNGVTVKFGHGLAIEDFRARRDGEDLILYFAGGTDEFRLVDAYATTTRGADLSHVEFGPNVIIQGDAVHRLALAPSPGDDDVRFGPIINGIEENIRDGGAGNDMLRGSDSVYVFGVGYGHDVVANKGLGGAVHFTGLSQNDVVFSRGADPMNIVVTLRSTGETLTIAAHHAYVVTAYRNTGVGQFVFTDGTLSNQQVHQKILAAERAQGITTFTSAGALVGLSLGAEDQTVVAGQDGVRLLIDGNSGRDTLLIKPGEELGPVKVEMIDLFSSQFSAALFYDLAGEVPGWKIALGSGPTSLLIVTELEKIYADRNGPLSYWDFEISFSGDQRMYGIHLASLLLNGLGGGTAAALGVEQVKLIVGTAGKDVIRSGPGAEILVGLEDHDTYFLAADTGHDIVADLMWLLDNASVEWGDTIKVDWLRSEVTFGWSGIADGQLKISAPGGISSITFGAYGVDEYFGTVWWIEFSDGERVSTDQLVRDMLAAAGDPGEVLQGDWDSNILDGRGGNDSLAGGPEQDVYVFGRGYGHDQIIELRKWNEGSGDRNYVDFAGNVTATDLTFRRSGDHFEHLVVTIGGDDGSLTILNYFQDWRPIDEFRFTDGSALNWEQVHDLAAGFDLSGDNLLETSFRGGMLDGGAGYDVLRGGVGNDIYMIGRGYDEDLIIDAGGSEDIVRFAPGIAPQDVVFSRSPDDAADLLIEVTGVQRLSVTIRGQLSKPSAEIEYFEFSDFTRLSARDATQLILAAEATSGDDTIKGSRYADSIDAGSGNDIITGGKGDDRIDGGAGRDVATFSGRRIDYEITVGGEGFTVRDLRLDGDGTDLLINVEDLQFEGDGPHAPLLHLIPVNSAPVANDDAATMMEDGTLIVPRATLLGNDSDPDGDQLRLIRAFDPSIGQVWVGMDGNVRYRPPADFNGTAIFSYEIRDPSGARSIAQVTVTVTGGNDAPSFDIKHVSIAEDGLSEPIRADDIDGDVLGYTVARAPQHGVLEFDGAAGAYRYRPDSNYAGTDSFSIVATDYNGGTATAEVSVLVTALNDAPTASNTSLTAEVGSEVAGQIDAGDPDDTYLSYTVLTGPEKGSLTVHPATGAFTYRPRLDASGVDVAQVAVSDGSGASVLINLSFNIVPAILTLPTALLPEDAVPGTIVGGVETSVDGRWTSLLSYSLLDDAGGRFVIDPLTGTLSASSAAVFDYEANSSHSVVVQVDDGISTVSATFSIQIANVAPTQPVDMDAAPDTVAEDALAGTTVGIVVAASDAGATPLSYSLLDDASGRFAIDIVTGAVTVAGALHFETASSHTIVVQASDGFATSVRTFTIQVTEALPILGTEAADVLAGTERADEILGLGGDDILNGLGGNDDIRGGDGNDILIGGAGADHLAGGAGDDTYIVDQEDILFEQAGEGVDTIKTSLASYTLPAWFENLEFTGTGAFTASGNTLNNEIRGGAGNDLILLMQGGDDSVLAGSGNDSIYFGGAFTAADKVDGEAGFDIVGLGGTYNLTLGALSLINVERLSLYSGSEIQTGPVSYSITTHEANVAAGTTLQVGATLLSPAETLIFVGAAETNGSFIILSGAGNDILVGGDQADVINGGAGDDQLFGRGGSDVLVGGLGSDLLRGGFGADIFRYFSGAESTMLSPDRIEWFEGGVDRIDLSEIDANSHTATNDAFTYIGSASFSGSAGQLRYEIHGTGTYIEGDINGDGVGDFRIVLLNGVVPLIGDFML